MKYFFTIVLATLFLRLLAQQSSPLSLTWEPSVNSEIRQQSSFQLALPLVVSENNALVVSPQYKIFTIGNEFPISGNNFNQFSLRFAWRHKLSDGWNAALFAAPSFSSATGNFSGNGLMIFSGIRLAKIQSPAFLYYFGLAYSRRFSSNVLVPVFGLKWKISPTLHFTGDLPFKGQLIREAKPNFYSGLIFKGNRFISHIPDNPDFDYFWFREQNLGLTSGVKIIRNFWLTAEAGYSVKRNFNLYTEPENPKWSFGLEFIQPSQEPVFKYSENGFYMKFGLVYRFDRNVSMN